MYLFLQNLNQILLLAQLIMLTHSSQPIGHEMFGTKEPMILKLNLIDVEIESMTWSDQIAVVYRDTAVDIHIVGEVGEIESFAVLGVDR